MPRRWELHWGSVPESQTKGREQHNEGERPRPWLIVSDDALQRAGLVQACPLTSNLDRIRDPVTAPFRVRIDPDMVSVTPGDSGIDKPGVLLCDQLRAMSLERFRVPTGGTRIGTLKPVGQAHVEARLCAVLKLTP